MPLMIWFVIFVVFCVMKYFHSKWSKAVILWIFSSFTTCIFSAWDKSHESSATNSKLEQMEWAYVAKKIRNHISKLTSYDSVHSVISNRVQRASTINWSSSISRTVFPISTNLKMSPGTIITVTLGKKIYFILFKRPVHVLLSRFYLDFMQCLF